MTPRHRRRGKITLLIAYSILTVLVFGSYAYALSTDKKLQNNTPVGIPLAMDAADLDGIKLPNVIPPERIEYRNELFKKEAIFHETDLLTDDTASETSEMKDSSPETIERLEQPVKDSDGQSEPDQELEDVYEEPKEELVSEADTYSDDAFYLAAAICREAGGESEEIQLLVGNIIINRVNHPEFPDTIYGVLTQHMQYGTMWRGGVSFPSWATQEVQNQCYSVANRLLGGERFMPGNVVFQAQFAQGSGIWRQYGDDYYFCYR